MATIPITGTSISALTTNPQHTQIFYQTLDRAATQSVLNGGTWEQKQLPWFPVTLSPLASASDGEKETRVFYLDADYIIQEYIFVYGLEQWRQGDIGKLKIKAIPGSRFAIVSYHDGGSHRIHLFYQSSTSLNVKELIHSGSWKEGRLDLPGVLADSGIAAVTQLNREKKREIYLFYQARTLALKSHIYDGEWIPDDFNVKTATGTTSISATIIGNQEIHVFWRDDMGRLVFSSKKEDQWTKPDVIAGIIPGHAIAVVGWEGTKNISVYLQETTGVIIELQSGNGGSSWSKPTVVVAGSKL